jgi:putative transposase
VLERTHDGRAFRLLNVIDEYTRECLEIRVERNLDHEYVQECLAELFCTRGVPIHLHSDNGPEFIANQFR